MEGDDARQGKGNNFAIHGMGKEAMEEIRHPKEDLTAREDQSANDEPPKPEGDTISIAYEGERVIEEGDLSLSLLDISLKHGIPHLHTCGRASRCSTCQVEILSNPENVLPRNEFEERFARDYQLPDQIRLACQTYLAGPIRLRRRVIEDTSVENVAMEAFQYTGSEQKLAVLFTDIRDFTGLTERMHSYDLFHVLNRYYHRLGETVLKNHGYIHQYYGDGMMALFGFYARNAHRICLDAITAGIKMMEDLNIFNSYLKQNFGEEIQTGIGIHFGRLLAGKLGHSKHQQLTVVGDVVNTASRIQEATKQAYSPLLISDTVYWELGATVVKVRPFLTKFKGKAGEHRVYEVQGFAPGFNRSREPSPRRD